MNLTEFLTTWSLSEEETRRECASGRLTMRGRQRLRCYYSDMRTWIARKRQMPPVVRVKVEAAGDLRRLEDWRGEQIMLCKIDYAGNTVTLPDGSVLKDVHVQLAPQH